MLAEAAWVQDSADTDSKQVFILATWAVDHRLPFGIRLDLPVVVPRYFIASSAYDRISILQMRTVQVFYQVGLIYAIVVDGYDRQV